jgi:hypothetical protein
MYTLSLDAGGAAMAVAGTGSPRALVRRPGPGAPGASPRGGPPREPLITPSAACYLSPGANVAAKIAAGIAAGSLLVGPAFAGVVLEQPQLKKVGRCARRIAGARGRAARSGSARSERQPAGVAGLPHTPCVQQHARQAMQLAGKHATSPTAVAPGATGSTSLALVVNGQRRRECSSGVLRQPAH